MITASMVHTPATLSSWCFPATFPNLFRLYTGMAGHVLRRPCVNTCNVIQAGEVDEADPWLRRTQWAVYLDEVELDALSAITVPPAEDADGIEATVRAIWYATLPVQKSADTHYIPGKS
ncbi:hypothetical protein NUU61_001319 [Penicillium alfredii]|uniref:Uncharacterized protein n=1 Tax=Penicillium alfredii TaxID=1506179 RepID=A0A9W9KLZ3_9EURO|nr:uncharacterized protein NUU61_001319 [Penicillium alfredii]KAJ5111689.1 hypothetical protein NUU61_001319 [Penicillium alfredii]